MTTIRVTFDTADLAAMDAARIRAIGRMMPPAAARVLLEAWRAACVEYMLPWIPGDPPRPWES